MRMQDRLKPLTSVSFLICLVLLLINDLYLKAAFHNGFTGKLSDFCGLFIFPIFWAAFLPKRKKEVFFLTALLFVYWKSDYASSLILFFGRHFFTIHRVVDPTDLVALIALPFAWYSLSDLRITFKRYIRFAHPYLIAAVTFFAFCATSQPRYVRNFDQPQYALFKSDALPDSNYQDYLKMYRVDSLLVVEFIESVSTRRAILDDDYDKNQIVKNLDKDIFEEIRGIKSLMPSNRITMLSVKTPDYTDSLRFKGGRLDGKFLRKQADTVLMEGFYTNGIEDSIWTFKGDKPGEVTKKTFVNGEATRVEQLDHGKVMHSNTINTRAEVITNKYIQLGILAILAIGLIALIVRNFRREYPNSVVMTWGRKTILALSLPIGVYVIFMCLGVFRTDHDSDIFAFFGFLFIIYIMTCPLFFIIAFWIKFRKNIDMLWYCLLLALLYTLFLEYSTLSQLSAGL